MSAGMSQKQQKQMAEAYIKMLEKVTLTTEHFNGAMLTAIAGVAKMTIKRGNIDAEIKGKKQLQVVNEKLIRLRHRLNQDLEDNHHAQVRRNMQMRDNTATLDKSFGFITKTMTGGFGFQAGMSAVVKAVAKSTITFNALGESSARLEKAQETMELAEENLIEAKKNGTKEEQAEMQGEKDIAERSLKGANVDHDRNQTKTGAGIVNKKGFSSMFKGLDKIGGIVKKGAMPIGIGMGVAGILMSVVVKALSASPLFQQIMKMLKFSVQLILMPIGTFFGAILRPILITLLRKFIIPMYSTYMPIMMNLGTSIGEGIVSFFDILQKDGIGAAMSSLFKDVDVGAVIWDVLAKVIPVFTAADFIGGLFKIGDGTDANGMGVAVNDWFTKGLQGATTDWDNYWTEVNTWFSDGISGISNKFSQIWTNYKNWVTTGLSGVATKFSEIWDSIVTWFNGSLTNISYGATVIFSVISGWFAVGLNKAETTFTGIWDAIISWFKKGISNASVGFSDIINTIVNAVSGGNDGQDYDSKGYHKADKNKDNKFSGSEERGWNWGLAGIGRPQIKEGNYKHRYANGGIINEPISGVGMNSGDSYLLGESGREMVTPMGKSGGGSNITINIQNMNGSDDDMRNLKKTILDVLQDSSTSRGRI